MVISLDKNQIMLLDHFELYKSAELHRTYARDLHQYIEINYAASDESYKSILHLNCVRTLDDT